MILISNTTKRKIPLSYIYYLISSVIKEACCLPKHISAVYCGNKKITSLNNKYLNHNYPTDTISFSYESKKYIEGEFYISLDTVEKNARYYQQSFIQELSLTTIHSVLHLIGYEDKTDKGAKCMSKMQAMYLETFSYLLAKKKHMDV